MKLLKLPLLLMYGYLMILLAVIYPIWVWIRNGIIQDLPDDEDYESSERGRRN